MGANPQGIQDGRVQLLKGAVHAAGQNGVIGALAPQSAIAQLRGEAGIPAIQAVFPDAGWKHQVGVGILGSNSTEHFEGHQAGRVSAARTLRGGIVVKPR